MFTFKIYKCLQTSVFYQLELVFEKNIKNYSFEVVFIDYIKNLILALSSDFAVGLQLSMTSYERLEIIKNVWTPSLNYNFPKSGDRNLKFQHSWLHDFQWLSYSAIECGDFCKIFYKIL